MSETNQIGYHFTFILQEILFFQSTLNLRLNLKMKSIAPKKGSLESFAIYNSMLMLGRKIHYHFWQCLRQVGTAHWSKCALGMQETLQSDEIFLN